MTLARGAKQLVVQEALETIVCSAVISWWFTPITNIGASAEGAEIATFLAPAVMCFCAPSSVVKIPVQSITTSAPTASHLRSSGLRSELMRISFPLTTKLPFLTSILPLNCPCTESYFRRYARCSTSNKSLIPTTSTFDRSEAILKAILPILPNPLIPIFTFVILCFMFRLVNLCTHDVRNSKELLIYFRVAFYGFIYRV